MCAPGTPGSPGGWEEVRSIDSEEETSQARRAGAGKQQTMSLGHENPTSFFLSCGHKSVFSISSVSIFPMQIFPFCVCQVWSDFVPFSQQSKVPSYQLYLQSFALRDIIRFTI